MTTATMSTATTSVGALSFLYTITPSTPTSTVSVSASYTEIMSFTGMEMGTMSFTDQPPGTMSVTDLGFVSATGTAATPTSTATLISSNDDFFSGTCKLSVRSQSPPSDFNSQSSRASTDSRSCNHCTQSHNASLPQLPGKAIESSCADERGENNRLSGTGTRSTLVSSRGPGTSVLTACSPSPALASS
jgi:hypothetical protein